MYLGRYSGTSWRSPDFLGALNLRLQAPVQEALCNHDTLVTTLWMLGVLLLLCALPARAMRSGSSQVVNCLLRSEKGVRASVFRPIRLLDGRKQFHTGRSSGDGGGTKCSVAAPQAELEGLEQPCSMFNCRRKAQKKHMRSTGKHSTSRGRHAVQRSFPVLLFHLGCRLLVLRLQVVNLGFSEGVALWPEG